MTGFFFVGLFQFCWTCITWCALCCIAAFISLHTDHFRWRLNAPCHTNKQHIRIAFQNFIFCTLKITKCVFVCVMFFFCTSNTFHRFDWIGIQSGSRRYVDLMKFSSLFSLLYSIWIHLWQIFFFFSLFLACAWLTQKYWNKRQQNQITLTFFDFNSKANISRQRIFFLFFIQFHFFDSFLLFFLKLIASYVHNTFYIIHTKYGEKQKPLPLKYFCSVWCCSLSYSFTLIWNSQI